MSFGRGSAYAFTALQLIARGTTYRTIPPAQRGLTVGTSEDRQVADGSNPPDDVNRSDAPLFTRDPQTSLESDAVSDNVRSDGMAGDVVDSAPTATEVADFSGRSHAARGTSTSAHTIADQTGIPLEYLRKILQRLARARLIVSERGRRGGFLLARNPDSITMLDVMQAVDGDLDDATLLNDGVIDRTGAAADGLRLWRAKAARDLRATLGRIALVDLNPTPVHAGPVESIVDLQAA